MKKMFNLSIFYFILAMIGGVFYREFTKFHQYTGITMLKGIHTHLLVLGMFLFLFLTLACKVTKLEENKQFHYFTILYNIALPFMVIMMLIRGVIQVMGIQLTHSMSATISGIAGLSHILILIAFILLFIALKKALLD